MLNLYNYLIKNINIFEASTGINLLVNKNIYEVINYLENYQFKKRCIIPDSDTVRMSFKMFEQYFADDINNDTIFYLKNNGNLCMYEPIVDGMTTDELKQNGITKDGEKYYLDGIKIKLEATSKKLNTSNNIKIWPEYWNKVKGILHGLDFKKQGAYVLTKENFKNITNDIYNEFKDELKEDSSLSTLFKDKISKKYVKEFFEKHPECIKYIANVLSEPLAILYLVDNIEDTQTTVKKYFTEDIGELTEIVIPIQQNWPIADFYGKFKNLDDRYVAFSVKSNGAGNTSTFLKCLPVANIDEIKINNTDRKLISEFFNEIIPQFNTKTKNVKLKINNSNKYSNIALYALSILKEQSKDNKISNINKIANAFEILLNSSDDSCNNKELLYKMSTLKGINNIEKIFVCLFNTNDKVINIIKDAVVDATSCFKITVHSDGGVKVIKQSKDSKFNIKAHQGGQAVDFIFNDDELVDIKIGHKSSQGQWFGYSFS